MRALLAFVGPAVAWALIGLIVGDWLSPIYALYGVGVGIIASGVFAITGWLPARSRRHGPAIPVSPPSVRDPIV